MNHHESSRDAHFYAIFQCVPIVGLFKNNVSGLQNIICFHVPQQEQIAIFPLEIWNQILVTGKKIGQKSFWAKMDVSLGPKKLTSNNFYIILSTFKIMDHHPGGGRYPPFSTGDTWRSKNGAKKYLT